MVLSRNGKTDSKAVYVLCYTQFGHCGESTEAKKRLHIHADYVLTKLLYATHLTAAFTTHPGRDRYKFFLMRNHKFPQSLKKKVRSTR